ncbi:MAG TPA: hypothetical protein VE196_01220 [Pseudonocardiaceae bacterium]|nr:hypothetical protein [Pseudonocardiaceae bacterium]
MSVRSAQLPALSACLTKLVPIIQQAQLDYLTDPGPTDDLIVRLVKDYQDGWEYTPGDAAYAMTTMTRLHIVANDTSGALGGLDPRIQATIDTFAPLIAATGGQTRPGLTAADLARNRFVNPTVRLH